MGGLVAEGWGDGVMGLRVGFINILVMYTDSLIVHYSTTSLKTAKSRQWHWDLGPMVFFLLFVSIFGV